MSRVRLLIAAFCLFTFAGQAGADSWRTSVGANSITIGGHTYRPYDGGASLQGRSSERVVKDLLEYIGRESTSPAKAWTAMQIFDTLHMERASSNTAAFFQFSRGLEQLKNNGDGEGPLAWAMNYVLAAGRWNRVVERSKVDAAWKLLSAQQKSRNRPALHLIVAAIHNAEGRYKEAAKPYLIGISNLIDANGDHTPSKASKDAYAHARSYSAYAEYYREVGSAAAIAASALSSEQPNKSDLLKMQERIVAAKDIRSFRLPTVSKSEYNQIRSRVKNAQRRTARHAARVRR